MKWGLIGAIWSVLSEQANLDAQLGLLESIWTHLIDRA